MEQNKSLAVFSTIFFLLIGVGFGIVLAVHAPGAVTVSNQQYDATIGNRTYSAVQEAASAAVIPLWVAVVLFIVILAVNNGAIAFLLTYGPLYFNNWSGYVVSSYLLVMTGYFPASVAMGVLQLYGPAFTVAAFLPHGIFEVAAVIIGASAGYCYLLGSRMQADRDEVKRVLLRRVLPLIVIGSLVEVFLTPLILYIIR